MPKFTVCLSALTDLKARVEIEAETPEAAAVTAVEQAEEDRSVFELPDEGLDPIVGSVEAFAVEDEDDEEVLSLPQTSYSDIADFMATARTSGSGENFVAHVAALNDLRDSAARSNALEESDAESADHWDAALEAAKRALAGRLTEPAIPAAGLALGVLEGLLARQKETGGFDEAPIWAMAVGAVDLLRAGGAVPLPAALALIPELADAADAHATDWSTGLEDGTYEDDNDASAQLARLETVIAAARGVELPDPSTQDEREFLVIGYYENGDRWAEEIVTHGPDAAEAEAKLMNPAIKIAAVIELVAGKMEVIR